MILFAPYPAIEQSIILRHPEFGNTIGTQSDLTIKYNMIGTPRAFSEQRSQERVLTFREEFQTLEKLEQFFDSYIGGLILVKDLEFSTFIGSVLAQPLIFNYGGPGDFGTVTFTFVGRQL